MALINENVLWASADKLRGSVAPSDYMHITLGLIFLKYISDRFADKYKTLLEEGEGFENDKDEYIADHIFWVPEKSRWEYVSSFSKQEEIGQKLDEAFIELEKENEELKGILPKAYSKPEVDKRRLGELVDLFTNELVTEDKEGDFMGQVYEYFMSKFARKLGEKGGEFFTPRCIVKLLVAMLNPTDGRVYDPCCGSGGMFVQCADFVKAHAGNVNNISVYGQEMNSTTWKLAKMNLAIRGISANLGDAPGDTFFDDKHKMLRCDYILANPPFNISDYGQPKLIGDPRWEFGTPPEGNANYAWIEHMYSKLAPNGIAGFVLANGSLSTSNKQELEIRRNMLEAGKIDCIITCPDKLFYTTGIPVSLWFIRKDKKNKDVLFIDARNMGVMIDRKVRVISNTRPNEYDYDKETIKIINDYNEKVYGSVNNSDIDKIAQTYRSWRAESSIEYRDIKGYCKAASLEEIRNSDYTLVPGRYVGIDDSNKLSEEEINAEIKKTSEELLKLFEESKELEAKVIEILKQNV